MLTKITRNDLPNPGGRPRNELREFARATLEEFVSTTKPGDIAEVTEIPLVCDDPRRNVDKLMSAFSTEYYHFDSEVTIRRLRRGERVFLQHEPWKRFVKPKEGR